jgi:pentatricopeptide repeat protein
MHKVISALAERGRTKLVIDVYRELKRRWVGRVEDMAIHT